MAHKTVGLLRTTAKFSPDKNRETLVMISDAFRHASGQNLHVIDAGSDTVMRAFHLKTDGSHEAVELDQEDLAVVHYNGVSVAEIQLDRDVLTSAHDHSINYPFKYNGAPGLHTAIKEMCDKSEDGEKPTRRLYVVGGGVVSITSGMSESRKWHAIASEPAFVETAIARLNVLASKVGSPIANFALGMDFGASGLISVTVEPTRISNEHGRSYIRGEARRLAELAQ